MSIRTPSSSGTSALWIPANLFMNSSGTPTFAAVGSPARWPMWLMDAAATEIIAATTMVPSSFANVKIELYWTNAGAGSGDVVWRASLDSKADAGTLANPSTLADNTITAPAQTVLKVSTLVASQAVDATKVLDFEIIRIGGNAADTLANDAGVIGVLLTSV